MKETKYRYYQFGEFHLDAYERELRKGEEVVPLTYKVFEVLLVLVENPGRILEKEELMQRVWSDAMVEVSNLKNSISALRKALGDAPGVSRYIQTLPKRGYRLVAEVVALPDPREAVVIKRHATTEIIVETLSGDCSQAQGQPRDAVSSERAAGWATSAATVDQTIVIPTTETTPGLSGRANFRRRVGQRKWLVAIGLAVLLALIAAGAIQTYRWTGANRPGSSYAFEGMQMTPLVNGGSDWTLISPDGKLIVYRVLGTAQDGLWVRQLATDSAIRLMSPKWLWGLSFTRDSNFVYCVVPDDEHPDGALYKIPVLGGPPQLILEDLDGSAHFSPDGQRMVFKRETAEDRPMLVTANLDGSDQRVVLPVTSHYTAWSYAWSPDGQRIAVLIIRKEVEDETTMQVIEIPAKGGAEREITQPRKGMMTGLTWLPDGSGLITTALDRETDVPQLWHISYPEGQFTRITNDSNRYSGVSITADGNTILARQVAVHQNLWVAESKDLNSARKITASGLGYDYLSWTPDGKIMFSEGEYVKSDLWVMNVDGTGRQRLTEDQSQNRYPLLSPDGRTLVYSSKRGGQRQIWRMDSDGRNARQLTFDPEGCDDPQITPDGQSIVYGTMVLNGWVLKKMPIAGGESVTLAVNAYGYHISPDGQQVAYQFLNKQTKRSDIAIISIKGGEPVKLLDHPDFPLDVVEQWNADGLFAIDERRAQIVSVPLSGARPRAISDFKTGERIFSFAFSPDRKQVVFSQGVSNYNPVLITNFKKR